jgi:hypothetical protein
MKFKYLAGPFGTLLISGALEITLFENGDVGNGDGNGLENIYTVVIF